MCSMSRGTSLIIGFSTKYGRDSLTGLERNIFTLHSGRQQGNLFSKANWIKFKLRNVNRGELNGRNFFFISGAGAGRRHGQLGQCRFVDAALDADGRFRRLERPRRRRRRRRRQNQPAGPSPAQVRASDQSRSSLCVLLVSLVGLLSTSHQVPARVFGLG